MVKAKFSSMDFWHRIEKDIISMCADIPEPTTPERKLDFINRIGIIKGFLVREEVKPKDLEFLDDEIALHKDVEMMALYDDKEHNVDPKMIEAYSRIEKGKEGVLKIPEPFNYDQLSTLSNGVFKLTGLAKFYISAEKTIYGKIVAEFYEHSQEIPVATIVEGKKDKDTGVILRSIKLFGQQFKKTEFTVIKEINMPFYIYRFITEDNHDMMLISPTQHEIGDYVVTGMETKTNDYKALTESTKILTKLPFFFAQKIRNRVVKFDNHTQFNNRMKQLEVNKNTLFDYPFTVAKKEKSYKLIQPTWYKWLIWAWLTHEAKGLFNQYPLHLLILGEKASGKSMLLNQLHRSSKENKDIFAGATSTLKSLVPSFKYKPAQIGYLAESNRFAFCDEFLRCLINSKTTQDGAQREEGVAIMNDLLEHQKREVGSGVSRAKVNMTARILAMTNPIRGVSNVNGLINGFDESFLSRWLIYYQTQDHVQMIRRSNDSELKIYDYKIANNDWISILDYLQSFSAKYDLAKIEEIYREVISSLNEGLSRHYDARHKHHIECILDGIVKTRCLMENDINFVANDEDYKILKDVWTNVIRSWLNMDQIKNIPVGKRVFYVPENAQYLYWKIYNEKKIISKNQCKEFAPIGDMKELEFNEAFLTLIDMGLIFENDGAVRTHMLPAEEDENQQKMFGGSS